jgi:hypothetical protein
MDVGYVQLVHGIEHTRARQQNELETIIAQHAIVVIEACVAGQSSPTAAPPFSDRLLSVHERWRMAVLYKAGASSATNWAAPSDAPEYRFHKLVSQMISDFIADNNSTVAPDFFGRLYMPCNHGRAQEMLRKFTNYTYYLRRVKSSVPRSDAFNSEATACIVAAMQLGAWMDATL